MTNEITISDGLYHLIKEQTNHHYALQLILFFADHPYARFNKLAIIYALDQDGGKRCIKKALSDLVDKGIIIEKCINSHVPVYSLAENMRSLVLELKKLALRQRQLLLCPALITKIHPSRGLNNGEKRRESTTKEELQRVFQEC